MDEWLRPSQKNSDESSKLPVKFINICEIPNRQKGGKHVSSVGGNEFMHATDMVLLVRP